MRYAPRAILAAGLGFAAAFVVACGGGRGLLSGDQSIALSGQADQISSAVDSGNCPAAVNASAALIGDVQTLPVTINPTLRRNLNQGATTIAKLAAKNCHQHSATPTTHTTTSTSSTTTQSSTSTSTSTTTTTTTPTTTTTTTSTSATTPTNPGTTSTTGGAGLGGGTTTTTGNGNGNSGGTGPGNGNGNGSGSGG